MLVNKLQKDLKKKEREEREERGKGKKLSFPVFKSHLADFDVYQKSKLPFLQHPVYLEHS